MNQQDAVSGRKVILVIAIATVIIGVVTFGLYLTTRQLDYDPDNQDTPEDNSSPFTAGAIVPSLVLEGLPSETCPDDYGRYHSPVYDINFCFPEDWQMTEAPETIVEPAQREPDYSASISVLKPANERNALAAVTIPIVAPPEIDEITTGAWDCDDAYDLPYARYTTELCFIDDGPMIFKGVERVIAFTIHAESDIQGLIYLNQTPPETSGGDWASFGSEAQQEALTLVASIRPGNDR